MKIVLLTAATGGGHMRAAHAAEESIQKHTEHEAVTVDALKAVGPAFDRLVCGSYLFMARKRPAMFGRLYRLSNKQSGLSNLTPKAIAMFRRRLRRELERQRPDAVISTHPFAATMCGAMKRKGELKAPLLSLITDYGAHREYLAENSAEAYAVACEDMIAELEAFGIPKEKVHPTGIPVHEVFFERPDRAELRRKLELDPFLPTVLFMAGSFGVSDVIGWYRDLEARLSTGSDRVQIVVITGKNEKLYQRFQEELAKERKFPTKLVYFTQEVQDFMHAADLLVTKPGGLTVSEALASGLPMAVFDAIPGQEEDNAAFLERNGMAIRLKPGSDIAGEITALLRDEARLERMRQACLAFDKSRCVREMVEILERLQK